jgi:IS1 family transposase
MYTGLTMNKLTPERRAQVVKCLVEGNSIRATVRMTGAAKNTVVKLLVDLGKACSEYQDRTVRDLKCKQVQCDEIWSFVGCKEANLTEAKEDAGMGDIWTWTALDADTKLILSWYVGERDGEAACEFMGDVAARIANRVQLTTDGHAPYLEAVEDAFAGEIDYAQLIKMYAADGPKGKKGKRSEVCTGSKKVPVVGKPDDAKISTSYVERQNLTMRMGMRRFTRLTNAFSKKLENHAHAIALHFMFYNFARPHITLSKPYPKTPAMAAGVADHVWSVDEIVGLLSN